MKSFLTGSPQRCGQLGLIGIFAFLVSLGVLHLMSPGFDWTQQYVSDMANEPLGTLFVFGTFVHGWGNLFLAIGLYAALEPGSLRTWGVTLFGLTALSILLAALFPVDVPGHLPTLAGRIHRTSAGAGFLLELAAMFVFSVAFGRSRRWRELRNTSLFWSLLVAITIAAFALSVLNNIAPGIFERLALATLMAWEIWVALVLINRPPASGA